MCMCVRAGEGRGGALTVDVSQEKGTTMLGVFVCVSDRLSLSPTFLPSIESTPLCFDLGVGLLGKGAEGQPSSLCSAWVVSVCVLLSSDPDSLHRKKGKKKITNREDVHFSQRLSHLL